MVTDGLVAVAFTTLQLLARFFEVPPPPLGLIGGLDFRHLGRPQMLLLSVIQRSWFSVILEASVIFYLTFLSYLYSFMMFRS